ncbi:tetratricopeptide repeat protein [Actinoallomurus purpureus]|uniref:tetratricopeptide repeat protein n=1 Tax=Actinoallomurus purpureus TaxID=478114 RepID=UPI002092DB5E|nr:tetratricopeptide repeat protein [Actinoallomurus purpureus]MCO6004319.1 tetratricopeptide repeat protein [Actinoallomurus purpureus]
MGLPKLLTPVIDAHAALRGPYTAGGAIIRAVVPTALAIAPDLVERHDLEIRTVAPEFRATIPIGRETLFHQIPDAERTRVHSRLRTARIAHGIADFLNEYLRRLNTGSAALVLENVDQADATDRELIAILLRRFDPSLLSLLLCTRTSIEGWPQAEIIEGNTDAAPLGAEDSGDLAARLVASDGTCDDPQALRAYEQLEASERARLHDARADELVTGDWSWRLGAIPYHRERGTDPDAAVTALAAAQDHCFALAFHEACVDLGRRGRARTEPGGGSWWRFTRQMALSLALLGQGEQSEALYDEAYAASADPAVHRVAGYEIAMLYTRHHDPKRHDHMRAMASINAAIAVASLLPDPQDRAFYEIFYQNGKALIELRLGNRAGALRLVDEGIARMDRELPSDRHLLDRCTLLSNRARLLAVLGDTVEALRAYDALLTVDPDYAEYHFDRANLLRSAGQDEAALAAYDIAIRLGPPFPEMYFNRAVLHQAHGDACAALRDLGRVLELEPGYVDAYVNRAGLRTMIGDDDGAADDIRTGLSVDPGNPHLICVRGQLAAAAGDVEQARCDFDTALAAEPGLAAALAGRAALAEAHGDPTAAVRDLTRALAAGEDAALLYNRAVAHRSAGQLAEARTDIAHALTLAPDDPDILQLRVELESAD